jgi:hypothetical protein
MCRRHLLAFQDFKVTLEKIRGEPIPLSIGLEMDKVTPVCYPKEMRFLTNVDDCYDTAANKQPYQTE